MQCIRFFFFAISLALLPVSVAAIETENGPSYNGGFSNGPSANGSFINGPSSNGTFINGPMENGYYGPAASWSPIPTATPTPASAEPTGSASNWYLDSPTAISTTELAEPSESLFDPDETPEPTTSPTDGDEVEEVGGHGVIGATDGSTLDIIISGLLPVEIKSGLQTNPEASIAVYCRFSQPLGSLLCLPLRQPSENKKFKMIHPTREEIQQFIDAATQP